MLDPQLVQKPRFAQLELSYQRKAADDEVILKQ
jgi:hypothetical protein